jgi:pyridinium-3,5-bisthiocarboxylic acid mononucleotide nickel chelatase
MKGKKQMLAYFDCFSGISGDMALGAFIDLGVPVDWLDESIRDIPLQDFAMLVSDVSRKGIRAKRIEIKASDSSASRNYSQIVSLVERSRLSADVKARGISIFEQIAGAEAEIHGCPKEKVHFHEIGGVDSIVDIMGTALCIEYLGITKIFASKIPLGSGFVDCRHGTIPLPAPATVSILKGVPVYGVDINLELVTPTGAAILKALSESFGKLPEMTVEKTGYGAGRHGYGNIPNLLRVIIGNGLENKTVDEVVFHIETCIDDMNPEIFSFLMERLFEDGALDVWWTPVYMKKNRPGTKVHVISNPDRKDILISRILSETTTIGVRYHEENRKILPRYADEIKTIYGNVCVKRITDSDGKTRIVPEYEVCKKIAIEKNLPLKVVYENIAAQANKSKTNG